MALTLVTLSPAAVASDDAWSALLERGEVAKAQALCDGLVANRSVEQKIQGHLCLAQLAMRSAKPMGTVVRDPQGRTFLRGEATGAPVDAALEHLKAARRLTPGQLELHHNVLALTVSVGWFGDLPESVSESISLAPRQKRAELLSCCLLPAMYAATEEQRYEEALAVGRVLERSYPGDDKVVANVGAVLMALDRDAEARPYLERSVAMAPKDALNRWNLGQYHARHGRLQEADRDFAKAVTLASAVERSDYGCRHAAFVEQMLKDRKRACEMQRTHCPADVRGACQGP
jgi:tetratricopeptide (TPR) repeat protein